ncbi:uncharacterized protein LOC128990264 isoform X2 [Macrosteles quadrilineatus]|uniref:uncharacterized protein LOC128990264 isoform X2 n=1 Tax=Macrosteles quadrilineatus TaxID=74068 RepID=UPI0023E28B32|nr:uncharacterized protein LOC128990264 isoform X2 [Macrosteles quadrilineatus]
MFGTKLRTWMETHIVRSRKKQHRNKEDKKSGNCSKLIGSSPCHIESNSFERQYGKKSPNYDGNKRDWDLQATDVSAPAKAPMSLGPKSHGTINNLSSPESAYSTGYSTDGTSPGASFPPEYYINIRTGTHYFHSHPGQPISGKVTSQVATTEAYKVGSVQPTVAITVVSPRPGRHKKEDGNKKKRSDLPESSTEEDIVDRMGKVVHCAPNSTPKVKNKHIHPPQNSLHRRTESYDESQQRASIQSQESGDSLSSVPAFQCTSPYLPGASPRQRNRIRTNPWLAANQPNGGKSYNSQGETSSTVGSSSTLSSSGCKQTSDDTSHLSPRSREKRRLIKEHLRDVKNCNTAALFSPVLNGKKHLNAVTTCSPQPNRACHHSLRSHAPASSSSSPSSSPSSASDDEHHGNTSDFSDDDVTLNEMLGKYDESYVYEKETDILSDSDPTDCEDQGDYGKAQLVGHCTYHHLPGHTPEVLRKGTQRVREPRMKRQSTHKSRERRSRRSSRNRTEDGRKNIDSPLMASKKRHNSGSWNRIDDRQKNPSSPLMASQKRCNSGTYRKSSCQSLENNNSCEAIPQTLSPIQLQRRRCLGEQGSRPGEMPGKYVNLNRVLMERLINNQRNGTRSADGTPVSLRKRGVPSNYNGKYIKNHYISNLISSDSNFNERRNSLEDKHHLGSEAKPRSNSLSVHSNQSLHSVPSSPGAGVVLNDHDKEGDLKYRQLIQEAEHIIEDLQVKTRTEYLSPTFRTKNGMERAKPSSPLVFSVPPSPLSLRYDIYRDGDDNQVYPKDHEYVNNNTVFDQPIYSVPKEKPNENEEGLFKTLSKTLEKIMLRGESDINKKLDKSVSDPFSKGKKKFVMQPSPSMFANQKLEHQNGHIGFTTPNLVRRSSTGNTPSKLSTFVSASRLNQNEVANQGVFRKIFRRNDKYKTTSFDENLDKHDFPENGFCFNTEISKLSCNHIYANGDVYNQSVTKQDIQNSRYMHSETRNPLTDYSPNGNTPTYVNGFQHIPWQHRTSQAERLKHLTDLQSSQKCKIGSSELVEKKPSLVSFRSFDLGNKHVVSSRYCPQSEPVKRKIYTCSATFEKLQKSLLRKHPEIQPAKNTLKEEGVTEQEEDSNTSVECDVLQSNTFQLQEEFIMCKSPGQSEKIVLSSSTGETG